MATIKSIEEKAKRYDEASKWMEGIYPTLTHEQQMEAEAFFPELKESEDERIMKALYKMAKVPRKEIYEAEGITKEQALAWLEKQGKQKETLCDKCKKTQPSHSCQDITALGRCALEKQGEQKLTKFEKAVKQVMEEAIECGDTHNLKADAEMLLSLVHNSSWSEEDKKMFLDIDCLIHSYRTGSYEHELSSWLEHLKDRVQPQSTWKPSDEQMKQLGWVAEQNKNNMIGKELMTLYQDLKKLRKE